MDTLLHLRAVPLFSGLTDADLALIEPLVKRTPYEVGAIVCRQGEIGEALYMVDSGELQTSHVDPRGVARDLDILKPNQFFGEIALLLGEPYPTTITARTEAHLLTLLRDDWNGLLNKQRDLCARLTHGMKPEIRTKFVQCRLPWLLRGEVPIVFTRKHWWALVRSLPMPVGLVLLLIVIAISAAALAPGSMVTVITWAVVLFLISLILVFVTLDWRNDWYIVTNRRVMHIERILLVRQERNEAPMEKIQNVEMRQPRYFHKIIGVSDIIIATASIHGAIVFSAVAHGAELRDTIFEQIQRTRAQHQYEEREQLKQKIRAHIHPSPVPPPAPGASPAAPKPKPARPPRRPLRQIVGDLFKLRVERNGTVTWRKHVFALFRQIGRPVAILLALLAILGLCLSGVLPSAWYSNLILVFSGTVVFGWMIWEWVDWGNDIYSVTQDRLMDLELNPLGVTKKSMAAPLIAITNVSVRQPSLLTMILNIGDVVIETAGATGQMTFFSVSQPRDVAREIMQHVDNTRARQLQIQREQQRTDMLQWFGAYHSILQEDQVAQPPAAPSATAPGTPSSTDSKTSA